MIENWLDGYSYNNHSILKEHQKKNEKEKLFAYFQYATNPEEMIPYMLFMNKAIELAKLTGAEVTICQTLCDHCRQQIKDEEVMLIQELYLQMLRSECRKTDGFFVLRRTGGCRVRPIILI